MSTTSTSAHWIALQNAVIGLTEGFHNDLLLEQETIAVDTIINVLNALNGGEHWVHARMAERIERENYLAAKFGSLDEQEDDYEDFDDTYGDDWDLDDDDDDIGWG